MVLIRHRRAIPTIQMTLRAPARGILAGDRLEGTGGCNVVFGAYRAEGTGALTVTELAWTEMACFPSEVMSVEQVFFQSLGLARSFRVDDTGLEISFEGGTIELVAADEADGVGDAPWPPHYPKMPGEPPRVQPSKMRKENWE